MDSSLREFLRRHLGFDAAVEPMDGLEGVYRLRVPGQDAVSAWKTLKDCAVESLLWPVIVGGDEIVDGLAKCARHQRDELSEAMRAFLGTCRSVAETLESATTVPFETWVAQRKNPQFLANENLRRADWLEREGQNVQGLITLYRQFATQYAAMQIEEFNPTDYQDVKLSSPWDLQETPASATVFNEQYRRVIAESVTVLLVPTVHSWEIPAHLWFATQDFEKTPTIHVAAMKWLSQKFGAEVIGVCDRTIEVVPRQPPDSWDIATQAAWHIRSYADCPITGDENATVIQWAYFLRRSPIWSFCWP